MEQELASNSAITRHQLAKAKLGEKYHVSALRRETEHVIEEQKQLLQTSTNSKDIDQELLKKASAVEAQVLTCYRDNKDRPLDCLEKVRELQSIARQLSLQQL